ncbi:MAG TPA: retroviral-like aspartic protease family protein [Candidatus Acidoferrum sp.]|nr:retroviral-like aspartic protease family protein [Candidatus Acidoferrum sp.]
MGTFYIGCKVENHKDPKKAAVVPKLLVDTGSEFTWLPQDVLKQIGVQPVKRDLQIQMANGQILTRTVGYAILRVAGFETIDEVVFAQPGDLSLLGSRALEGMNVQVDARRKKLVAAGPVVAATAIRAEAANEEQLKRFAAKLIWWQPPEVSLGQPRRLLGQVMARGDWPEVVAFKQALGWGAFRDALINAEAGLFDIKSWTMWHRFFGLPAPELPKRAFLKEFDL